MVATAASSRACPCVAGFTRPRGSRAAPNPSFLPNGTSNLMPNDDVPLLIVAIAESNHQFLPQRPIFLSGPMTQNECEHNDNHGDDPKHHGRVSHQPNRDSKPNARYENPEQKPTRTIRTARGPNRRVHAHMAKCATPEPSLTTALLSKLSRRGLFHAPAKRDGQVRVGNRASQAVTYSGSGVTTSTPTTRRRAPESLTRRFRWLGRRPGRQSATRPTVARVGSTHRTLPTPSPCG